MTNSLSIPTPKTVQSSSTNKRFINPSIYLERPTRETLNKDECLTFKLQSTPGDETSPTYGLTVGYFRTGTPEELLLFIKNLQKIIVGTNITTGPEKYTMARRLLQGDALAAFNRAATQNGTETNEHFKACLLALKTYIFPRKALSNQKRYMRRILRKPRNMTTREFMTRLVEINEYLNEFPPALGNQKLPEDELMDIAEFAVPATWQ